MDALAIVTLIMVAAFLALVPGPMAIFLSAQAALHGRVHGTLVAVGLCLGLGCYALLATFLIGTILHVNPDWLAWLKLFGSMYLVYYAITLWYAENSTLTTSRTLDSEAKALPGGMMLALSNPQRLLFLMAFLPLFIQIGREYWSLGSQMLVVSMVYVGVFFFAFLGLVIMAYVFGHKIYYSVEGLQFQRWVHRMNPFVFGLLFLKLGITQLT